MKQYILISLISIITFSYSTQLHATNVVEDPNEVARNIQPELPMYGDEESNVSVVVRGSQLYVHVVNCQGQNLRVYDLVGKLKYEAHIDSQDKTIRLQLGKGIYLVNVNKQTRRVSIRG